MKRAGLSRIAHALSVNSVAICRRMHRGSLGSFARTLLIAAFAFLLGIAIGFASSASYFNSAHSHFMSCKEICNSQLFFSANAEQNASFVSEHGDSSIDSQEEDSEQNIFQLEQEQEAEDRCNERIAQIQLDSSKGVEMRSKALLKSSWRQISSVPRADLEKIMEFTIPSAPGTPNSLYLSHKDNVPDEGSFEQVSKDCPELAIVSVSQKHCLAILENRGENMPFHVYRYRRNEETSEWQLTPRVKRWALKLPGWKLTKDTDEKFLIPFFGALAEMNKQLEAILKRIHRNNKIIVMALNEGNLDLLMNFIASAKRNKVDISNLLVFGATPEISNVVNGLGYAGFHHSGLGNFPSNAARSYGDLTFIKMMWIKIAPVYLVMSQGYDVLFQDADLLWFKDPFPYFDQHEVDTFWMDDGARSERYTPLYGNSGFYFFKNNPRTMLLAQNMLFSFNVIRNIQSHQEVLTQLTADHISRNALTFKLLSLELFPSGKVFHHNKAQIQAMIQGNHPAFVFHMCWTTGKQDKVRYLKEVGWWYLPEKCDITQIMQNAAAVSKEGKFAAKQHLNFLRDCVEPSKL